MKKETKELIGLVLITIGLIMMLIGTLAYWLTRQLNWIILVPAGLAGPFLCGIIIRGSNENGDEHGNR